MGRGSVRRYILPAVIIIVPDAIILPHGPMMQAVT